MIEAINKQPTVEVIHVDALDKIRDEIEQTEIHGHIRDVECFRAGINVALNVIDKYRAEIENYADKNDTKGQ